MFTSSTELAVPPESVSQLCMLMSECVFSQQINFNSYFYEVYKAH